MRRRDSVVILEQATFPLRKTSFLLSAEHLGDGWLELLNLTMRCGTARGTRTGDRLTEVLNVVVTIRLARGEGKVPPFFDFGAEELEGYYRHLISSHREDLETINRLQRSRDSTAVLLELADRDRLDDAPCVVLITFNIVNERLCGSYVIQCDDIYNVWPLKALSLLRLQREVAKRIGIPVDSATFISLSARVHERDWPKAWAKLDKWFKRRRPLPYRPDESGMFLLSPENDRVRALLLSPQADKVLWEGASSDPEHLIRYIVDTMPWLSPQHVRYLGKEALKLTRALQEGVPYEQD